MKLKILELHEPYRSLGTFKQEFPTSKLNPSRGAEIDPICLVGLNGCGKSNMLELIADIFYFLDRYFLLQAYEVKKHKPYLPYAKLKEKKEIFFNIEYTIKVNGIENWVKIERKKQKRGNSNPIFHLRNDEKEYDVISNGNERIYLPKVIAYTSGLNELLSMPFMELQDYYAREVTYQVITKKDRGKKIIPPNLMLMTYDSNAIILIANYLLNSTKKLKIFKEKDFLRVKDLDSFRIKIQLNKGVGKNKKEGIQLNEELDGYIHLLQECATCYDITAEKNKGKIYTLDYLVNDATKKAFKDTFETPQKLFEALNKLSLLNTFAIPDDYRTELQKKRKEGIALKFPTISTLDKIFSIEQIELILDIPKVRTQYINLSDGEHQFIHIVGGILLFDKKERAQDILYLLDEPETHFNPQWRSKLFSLIDDKMDNYSQEIITTTHSPFILSDCHGYNVFTFKRDGEKVSFKRAEWETYGSSFSFILRNFFNFDYEISKKSYEDLEKLKDLGVKDLDKLTKEIRLFGDSLEKLYALKHIEDLKKQAEN